MSRALDAIARLATRRPAVTLLALVAVTLALGALAGRLQVDTGVEGFAPEGGVAASLDAIEERFTTAVAVQVVVDAGPGGDVLTPASLAAAADLEDRLRADETVGAALAADTVARSAVVTYATPFEAAAAATGSDLEELDEAIFAPLATGVLDAAGEQATGLFSDDLTVDPPRARAGLVVVELDATAPTEVRAEASRRIDELVAQTPLDGTWRGVLSLTAIEDGIQDSLARDVPVLLGTSLLLVLLVLGVLFRTVVDVVVGFTGLLASIVWMAGLSALLGPGVLGWIGPFNQVSIAVPVLLVGLGIDYSVHLTTRYREQRGRGDAPISAARTALGTVGVALVLATVASVAGFLANVVTPLPPIRDFGIIASLGIVSAFVLLGFAVPAARTLVDTRRDRRAVARAASATDVAQDDPPGLTPRWARWLTVVAVHHGRVALGVAVALVVAGAVAATGLSTEFDDRDFLPEGEPVLAVIDRLDQRFGGGAAERTYLLVEGEPTDPALLDAVAQLEQDLADVTGVRTVDGSADVTSVLQLRQLVGNEGRAVRQRLADDLATWDDPAAAAAAVPLPEPLDVDAFEDELGGAVELPQDLVDALDPRLPPGRSPALALAETADPAELETQVRAQLAERFAAQRPAAVDDATLALLVDRPASELTTQTLMGAGLPLDVLPDEEQAQLARLEALEAVGPVDATDGATVAAHLDVLRVQLPQDVAGLLDDDGLLLSVSTQAGADGAEALATDLEAAAAPVEAAGGRVAVASDLLVQADIIEQLAAAQLLAIVISLAAAGLLLAVAAWFSARAVGLGLIGIVPSVLGLVVVLGVMRLIGLPFNALTATVASIAVGIGVPYGIHLINRYREALADGRTPEDAIGETIEHTGSALVGSAVTTGLAFVVLLLSGSVPIRQFGGVSTMMIVAAVLACLLVQPALLVVWGRRHLRRNGAEGREQLAEPTLLA